MGIPSYFSQIIRKYAKIIQEYKLGNKVIHNLYLDSNSIIYDAIQELKKNDSMTNQEYENEIYKVVCFKIEEIIEDIGPCNNVFIAFDGVAPLAKMKQQRERRFKSHIISSLEGVIKGGVSNNWDKTAITPGTNFMDGLNVYIKRHFERYNKRNTSLNIIVSGSDDVGEGEHKLFSFIRQHTDYHNKTNTMIYGLDSDLIMLCLNHLHISQGIYLVREMPEFASVIQDVEYDTTKLYYLDIYKLSKALMKEMGCTEFNNDLSKRKMLDYVFISFMLGNDFLPHFPGLNIRTNGIDLLLETYFDVIPEHKSLNTGERINWKLFKKFVAQLAETEHSMFKKEYNARNRFETRFYPSNTVDEKLKKMNAIPQRFRKNEKYIDPYTMGWENRYYDTLLHINTKNTVMLKNVCVNYLEGLEWVMKYYHSGCINYKWCYNHSYPPLLIDLVKYIPEFNVSFVDECLEPVHPLTQLSFVLPRKSLTFLPDILHEYLLEHYEDNYRDDFNMEWSYCKYFWESHPVMNTIDLDTFEKSIMDIIEL